MITEIKTINDEIEITDAPTTCLSRKPRASSGECPLSGDKNTGVAGQETPGALRFHLVARKPRARGSSDKYPLSGDENTGRKPRTISTVRDSDRKTCSTCEGRTVRSEERRV